MATVIGKPCGKCGSTERYANGKCVPCRRAASEKWRQENREKARERTRKWRAENPEEKLEYNRKWRAENPEKVRERSAREIERLSDAYVAKAMRITVKDAPPELIAAKRQQLLINRATKQLIETIKEKQDEH